MSLLTTWFPLLTILTWVLKLTIKCHLLRTMAVECHLTSHSSSHLQFMCSPLSLWCQLTCHLQLTCHPRLTWHPQLTTEPQWWENLFRLITAPPPLSLHSINRVTCLPLTISNLFMMMVRSPSSRWTVATLSTIPQACINLSQSNNKISTNNPSRTTIQSTTSRLSLTHSRDCEKTVV